MRVIQLHEREDRQKHWITSSMIKSMTNQSSYEHFVLVSKTVIVAIITVRYDNMCKLIICIVRHLIKK